MKNINISIFKIIIFLLYFITICNINFAYIPFIQNIKYVLIIIIAIYLVPKVKTLLKKENILINILLLLFIIITLYSSFLNQNSISDRNTFKASIVYLAIILELFWCIEYAALTNKIKDLVSFYYNLTIIWTIIVDFLVLFMPNLYKETGYYICGGKFFVTYLHILLIGLYILNKRISKKKISKMFVAIIFVISLLISRIVDCNTGMLGILMFVFLVTINKKAWLTLKNQNIFVIFLLFCSAFCFMYKTILSSQIVQNIVVNTLGRNLTLTGRTDIYEALPVIMKNHYFLGYGYGSSYEVCMKNIGYANTQNGLAEWVLQIGIPGTATLVLIMYCVFLKASKKNNLHKITYPVIAYIYVLSFLGTVEITINIIFIFLLALLYGLSSDNNIQNCIEN